MDGFLLLHEYCMTINLGYCSNSCWFCDLNVLILYSSNTENNEPVEAGMAQSSKPQKLFRNRCPAIAVSDEWGLQRTRSSSDSSLARSFDNGIKKRRKSTKMKLLTSLNHLGSEDVSKLRDLFYEVKEEQKYDELCNFLQLCFEIHDQKVS
eukprot:TRINITY_DN5733_c0_g1_i2.p1 TRINITY_DN5733_c0_g1~~TRINITY_DN5733_c0_g1_i2.p1  ORF type:complete len:151 (-),score=15.31 TRINITY_DN5733_c0_g1_i2:129-581(-)